MRDPFRTRQAGDHGRFFDGRTAAAHAVTIGVLGNGFEIRGEGGRSFGTWRYDGLDIEPSLDVTREASLMHADHPDQRLVITDREVLRRLRNAAPAIFRPRPRRHSVSLSLLQVALIAGILAAIVFVIVPGAAGLITAAVPSAWENEWGEKARTAIIGDRPVCAAPEGRQALEALTRRLVGSGPGAGGPNRINVTVVDAKIENAVATIGGQIIVFRKLIERMEGPDELAGVLAHEIAHVRARHPLTHTVEALATVVLANLFGTSASGAGGSAAGLGGVLVITSYGRAKEEEADRIAVAILREARISPLGLARFFERLQASPQGRQGPTLLSTHPATGERLAKLRAAAASATGAKPALGAAEWQALKSICG